MGRPGANSHPTNPQVPGLRQVASGLIAAGISDSTTHNYKHAWKLLVQFCSSHGHLEWAATPVLPSTVMLFLTHKFASGTAGATLAFYCSAISYVHKLKNLQDPTHTFAVQKLVIGAQKLSPRADIRLPITAHILSKLVPAAVHTEASIYMSTLLACAFTCAFHGFFRIGELVPHKFRETWKVIAVRDISLLAGEQPQIQIELRQSKTGVPHQSSVVTLQAAAHKNTCPVHQMLQFLHMRGHHPGPLFAYPSGVPITRQKFSQSLAACIQFIGLDPARFTGHSFRIGAATQAAASGLWDAQIRHLGRWRSEAFKRYIRLQ